MALDRKGIEKPARKLRKLLKKMPATPVPADVHSFRTNARRLETVLQSFPLDDTKKGRRLSKQIAKMRKAAGKVRDLDVLTEYVSTLHLDPSERECSVRLLEYLGAERGKQASKFNNLQQRYLPSLRRDLKSTSRKIDNILPPQGDGRRHGELVSASIAASAFTVLSELREPQLGKSNLHEYRLKVKELRNLLQMAEDADQQPFVDQLGDVKDAIGEWHDWEVLVGIAQDALGHGNKCKLIQELRKTAESKYESALQLSEAMRRDYLHLKKKPARSSSGDRSRHPAEPVWSATASLTA